MATIKDVAKIAGVSVSTVSIIIGGKAEERKISQNTVQKVHAVMASLGYTPNLSARRLRSPNSHKYVIAFYWPLDYRIHILASMISGIQNEIKRQKFDCELVIQTYESGKLEKSASGITSNTYSGIIVGATAERDTKFLEKQNLQIPLVLINRSSKKHSTVSTDNEETARTAVNVFLNKGCKEVAIICSENPYVMTNKRTKFFVSACKKEGIHIEQSSIIQTENSLAGGAKAAKAYLALKNRPKFLYCASDSLALGVVSVLNQKGLKIPEDVEILAIGLMEPDATYYATPPLNVISLPNEEMSAAALSIIIDSIRNNDQQPIHKQLATRLLMRDSVIL